MSVKRFLKYSEIIKIIIAQNGFLRYNYFMEKKVKAKSRGLKSALTAVAASTALWALFSGVGALKKFEFRIYDMLLATRPITEKYDDLALVEIDDISIDKLGPWPWSRDIISDVLLRLREVGARKAVFDIEYLSPSKVAVNPEMIQELKDSIGTDRAKEITNEMFRDNDEFFSKAIQFFGNTWLTINTEQIISVSQEDYDYASQRFLFKNINDPNELIKKGNEAEAKANATTPGFSPTLNHFIKMAQGAGFVNIIVDKDGTRRRIELLNKQQNGYLGQLVFAPLLKELDVKEILRTKTHLILKDALQKDGKRKDIRIPVDKNGCMLIHWAPGKYADSFRHESVMIINQLLECENAILANLAEFTRVDLTDAEGVPLSYIAEIKGLLEDADYINNFRSYIFDNLNGHDIDGQIIKSESAMGESVEELQDSYFASRNDFFARVQNFYNGNYQQEIQIAIESLLGTKAISREDADMLTAFFDASFDALKSSNELYLDTFASIQKNLKGAFCIIGNMATGSTDLGSTPFQNFFPNVGTHANVYNTIMTGQFITPLSPWWAIAAASILFFIFALATLKARPSVQNITGGILIAASIVTAALLMSLFSIYVPIVAAILIEFTSYLALMIIRFSSNEKERALIKSKFGAYVAPEVVEQIIQNPKYAQVGGDNKELTALFSDVRKFSKFTEIVNNINGEEKGAEQLVAALNNYLGALSDAIQSERGTIDKYVGDEIVSFFGAPIDDPEHAYHSCAAAIKMREAEEKINKEFYKEFKYPECAERPWKEVAAEEDWTPEQTKKYLSYVEDYNSNGYIPMLLQSRVGLNSGRMVVGNMGTEKKLNYTIMGNNVNLASRLEGTNKVYGSWIMCSQSTYNLLQKSSRADEIVTRSFDAVRVINVERPVRIYNILGFRHKMNDARLKAAAIFNRGMECYMKGSNTPGYQKPQSELEEAKKYFDMAAELYPNDESSAVFSKRCVDFIQKGIPQIWDGVYTMETK